MLLQDFDEIIQKIFPIIEAILPCLLWSMGIILAIIVPIGNLLKNVVGLIVSIFPGPESSFMSIYYIIAGVIFVLAVFLCLKFPERKINL